MNLYGYGVGDPINNSDPTGLSPCTSEQRERGWADIKAPDGSSQCMSNNSAHPVTINAQKPAFLDGLISHWQNSAEIRAGSGWEPVQLGIPSWVGGPGGGAAKLTTKQVTDLARWLGFGKRVKDAPFNSMGQAVFSNGRFYISQDLTMHQGVSATWKLFDMRGNRLGTFNHDLTAMLGH